MFPTLRVSFTGIRTDQRYAVLLDVVPVDNKRYRYAYHRSSWLVAGKADPPAPNRLYAHPDSPYSGEQLRKQVVSFEKVKLTNNEMDKNGQVRTLRKFFALQLFWRQFGSLKQQNRKIQNFWCFCTFSLLYMYEFDSIKSWLFEWNRFKKNPKAVSIMFNRLRQIYWSLPNNKIVEVPKIIVRLSGDFIFEAKSLSV